MYSCWYADSQYGNYVWLLPPNGSTPFSGKLEYLNMEDSDHNLLALPLNVPDPTNPGAWGILWFWFGFS
jgi:hypothetical protein